MTGDSQPPSEVIPSPSASVETAAGTSPTPFGRRGFLAGVAGIAGASAAAAVSSSAHAAVPSGASYYVPVTPTRLADTRTYGEFKNQFKDFTRVNSRTIRIKIAGKNGIASDAVAAVISVAVINNGSYGWVRATPARDTAGVANVLLEPTDDVVLNLATVKLNAGSVDITGLNPYDVVVDITGVYRPTSVKRKSGRLEHLSSVHRLAAGTHLRRASKMTIKVPQVPTHAIAVVVNLTAANARENGYLTAYPSNSARPPISSVNYARNETRGAGSIIKLGTSGGVPAFDVYAGGDPAAGGAGGAEVYADLAGYITGDGAPERDSGLFVPITPVRILDTRRKADIAAAGGRRRLWPGWSRAFRIPNGTQGFPAGGAVSGVAMNVTSVASMNVGYVTVLPAQTQRRIVSNLNISRPGQTVANHVISKASTKGVECFSFNGAHIVCDVAGWYTGSPVPWTHPVPPEPDPPPAPFDWSLSVPDMFLYNNPVQQNFVSGYPVVDRGYSWHWTNTGYVGQSGTAIVVFGHRTEAGGPYRYQHFLTGNSRLTVQTPDQRLYTYKYVWEQITSEFPTPILNAARARQGSTFTLVACSKTDGTPTSLRHRLVTTFELELRSNGRQFDDLSPTID